MLVSLREHQTQAVEVCQSFSVGRVILPTGTGKSYIEAETIKRYILSNKEQSKAHVVVAPRILLSFQNLKNIAEYLTSYEIQAVYLNVNSGAYNANELNKIIDKCGLQAYEVKSTTDFAEIKKIYQYAYSKDMPLIISSTYDSVVQIQKSNIDVYSYIFDEAHYLAGNNQFHEATRYSSVKKFFFTATPKVTDSDEGVGMNNEKVYGKEIYRKPPKEMIEKGEMVKPAIHLVGVIGDYAGIDYNPNYDYKNITNGILSAFSEHEKVINRYSSIPGFMGPKLLVTLEGQRSLEGVWNSPEMKEYIKDNPNVHVVALSSDFGVAFNGKRYKNSNKAKEELFNHVQALEPKDKAIILHVDMLSEGIDVPGITGVMPFRNFGKIKFLQNLGRATRLFGIDRTHLYKEIFQPNEYDKYIKPYAWLILPVFTQNSIDFTERYKTILRALRNEYGFSSDELIMIGNANSATELEEFDEAAQRDREIRSIKHQIREFFHQIEKEEQMDFIVDKYFRVNRMTDLEKGLLWKTLLVQDRLLETE